MNQTATLTQDAYLQSVIDFIAERLGMDKRRLSAETLIEEDLYLAGLDGLAFYNAFFQHFALKNPADFNASRYVTRDVPSYMGIVKQMINPRKYNQAPARDVTLEHLARCVERRSWIDF